MATRKTGAAKADATKTGGTRAAGTKTDRAKADAGKTAAKPAVKHGAGKHNPAQFYSVVRRPIVTEKSTTMQSLRNQFTFEVARSANKIEVKKAVETLFGVKVVKVNIVGVPSKQKRAFGRPGATKPWKKAVITLREGDSIDVS